jgi:hypothetical protein
VRTSYCSKCSHQNAEGSANCDRCGAPIRRDGADSGAGQHELSIAGKIGLAVGSLLVFGVFWLWAENWQQSRDEDGDTFPRKTVSLVPTPSATLSN